MVVVTMQRLRLRLWSRCVVDHLQGATGLGKSFLPCHAPRAAPCRMIVLATDARSTSPTRQCRVRQSAITSNKLSMAKDLEVERLIHSGINSTSSSSSRAAKSHAASLCKRADNKDLLHQQCEWLKITSLASPRHKASHAHNSPFCNYSLNPISSLINFHLSPVFLYPSLYDKETFDTMQTQKLRG